MRRWLVIAVCLSSGLSLVGAWSRPASAQVAEQLTAPLAGQEFDFDIEAQPLETAVERFIAITGISVVYQASLSAGRLSAPLKGRHMPDAALRMLVSRAQLRVLRSTASGYVLVQLPGQALKPTPFQWRSVAQKNYYGVVQHRLREVICEEPRIARDAFRAALQFWIDPGGRIDRVHLLDTTGSSQRDAVLREILTGLMLAPPPQDVELPLIMVLLPREHAISAACHVG